MIKKIFLLIILFISHFTQANEVIWPLSFEKKANLPQVTLNIRGEEVLLLLDTGTRNALHLPIEVIKTIPNKVEQANKIKFIDLSGNKNERRQFIVNNLELGSFIFKNVDVLEYKKWGLVISSDNKERQQVEESFSVIGLDLFKDYLLTINFPERQLIISDEYNSYVMLDNTWISLPFVIEQEGIVISVSDDIKTYKMVLDTGATLSIIKKSSLAQKTFQMNKDDGYQFIDLKVNNIDSNKIKAIILDSLPAEFQADGLLGGDFLNKHIVKIDFKNKKLWVKAVK